jgi:hypothetical protein
MQRAFDLANTAAAGSDALASITLTTAAPTSSNLDADPANGLQLTIDSCSQPWTEAGTSPAFTYTCGGTTQSVLASRPVIGTDVALANLASLATGTTDHLRATLALPDTTPQTGFANVTSTLTFTFTGTQRAGTDK